MQNAKLLIGVIGGTLALVLLVAFLFSNQSSTPQTPQAVNQEVLLGSARNVWTADLATAQTEPEASPTTETPETATESAEPKTEITIVEFSDFECPACRNSLSLVKQVLDQYGENIRFIYRHLPLESIHKNARAAAMASEYAADQGKFWDYHDLLFEKQDEWAGERDPKPFFRQYAEEVGLDMTNFDAAFDNSEYKDRIDVDQRDGYALGVQATPTFYVDGVQVNTQDLPQVVQSKL